MGLGGTSAWPWQYAVTGPHTLQPRYPCSVYFETSRTETIDVERIHYLTADRLNGMQFFALFLHVTNIGNMVTTDTQRRRFS
jgi:hypothetical protein